MKKYKRLVYRKNRAFIGKQTNRKKQPSFYTPDWIKNTQLDGAGIKHYLEIDYFTLSTMMVYEPFLLNKQKVYELYSTRKNIYRLYNWKYIT